MSRISLALLSGAIAAMTPPAFTQEPLPIAEGESKFLGNIHAPTPGQDRTFVKLL